MLPSNLQGLRAPASISAIKHVPISSTLLLTTTVTNGRSPLTNRQVITAPLRRGCHWHNRRTETWLSPLDPLFQYYARRRHRSVRYRLMQALRRKSSWERDENDWGWRTPSSWSKNASYARWTDEEGFTSSKTDRAKRDVDDSDRNQTQKDRKGKSEEGEGYELSEREIRWKKRMDEIREAIERDPFSALFGKNSYMPSRDWIRGIFPGIWSDIEAWKAKLESEAMGKGEKIEKESSKQSDNSSMKEKFDKPSTSAATNTSAVKQTPQASATPKPGLEYDPITMRMVPRKPEKQESTQEKQKLQNVQDEAIDIHVKKFVDPRSQPAERAPKDTIPFPLGSQHDASRLRDPSAAACADYDRRGTTGKPGPTSPVNAVAVTPEEYNGHPLTKREAGPQPPHNPMAPALKQYDSKPDHEGRVDPRLPQNPLAVASSGEHRQLTSAGISHLPSTQDSAPLSSGKHDSRYSEIEHSIDKASNGQVRADMETAKDAKALPTSWLAREGFGSQTEELPSLELPKTTGSSVDSREEHSKEPALPGKYAGSKAVYVQSPEAVQTNLSKPAMPAEDLDVLRASDVRATMGLTKKPDKDPAEQRPEIRPNWKDLGTAQKLHVLRNMMVQVKTGERLIMLARRELSLMKNLPKYHPLRPASLSMDLYAGADMGDLSNKQSQMLSANDSTKTKGEAKAQESNRIKDIAERLKVLNSKLASLQRRMEQVFLKLLLARGVDVSRELQRNSLGVKSPAEKLKERIFILSQTDDPDDKSLQSQKVSFERRLERKRLGIEKTHGQPEMGNFGRIYAPGQPHNKPSGALETSLQRGLERRRLIIDKLSERVEKRKLADTCTVSNLRIEAQQGLETSLQREIERKRLGMETSKLRRGSQDVVSAAGMNGSGTLQQEIETLNARLNAAGRKLEAAVKAQETKLHSDGYAPESKAGGKSYARMAAAGRKLEEEIKAQQAAMQRFEHGGHYHERGGVHNLSERKLEARRPGEQETLEGELAVMTHEGTVSPKTVNFTSGEPLPTKTPSQFLPANRSSQPWPTDRASQPSTEEIAKQEQRERDRALYREVRDIYETAYGVIDTKHKQGAILQNEDRVDTDVHKAIAAYDKDKSDVYKFTVETQKPDIVPNSPETITEAQSLSTDDGIIAPGYEIVHNAGDLLILKKKSASNGKKDVSLINPIDGTPIGNFASPTGFVNHEPPSLASPATSLHASTHPPSESTAYSTSQPTSKPTAASTTNPGTSGGPVRRQEPVFSGQRSWPRHVSRRERRRKGRFRRAARRVLFLGVWTAACCYAVGVVAEYFRTGGSTGLGPQGF